MTFPIWIDGQALTSQTFLVVGITSWMSSAALQQVTLAAGTYQIQCLGGHPGISFEVTPTGQVAYEPAFEAEGNPRGFLQGSGTTTLRLVGFDIVFDGAPLTMTQFIVSGITGWIETHALQTLRLLPAHYSLQLPGASPNIVFQITNDGLVAYDPAFEAFLHGSSTKTLHLVGFDIVFDGAPLTMTQFIVSGVTGWIETHALQTLRLLPAYYSLQLPGASPNIVFQITNDGLVAYDPAFEAFLHGSSTKTLHLVGFDIVFDGAPLTMTQFIVSGVTGWIETHALQTLRLLPAYYSLQLPGASPNIVFQITNDGLVAYDPAFEAFLHGSSTKTLHLVGFDIVFDGAPLTMTQFIVSGITGWIETHALQTLRLLPAHYSLQLPGASPNIVFQITNDGLVAYDPAFEAFLHGSSTKTLHLVGFDIVFDGAPLTMTQFIVSGITGWIETHALQTLRLLPAHYSLQLPGASPNIVFQITNDGLVAYDPAFEAFLHGSSTKTLHLVGFDIVFDGAPLTMTQFIVSGITGWIETHALQTLRLLPAHYSLQLPGASPNIVFQITNDGLVAYDPAFEAFLHGSSTKTLHLVGFDIVFDGAPLTMTQFIVSGITGWIETHALQTLRLLPAHYSLQLPGASPNIVFQITNDGLVAYDPAFEAFLHGSSTKTLHLVGFDIVFDGAPLTMTQFIVSGITGWIETHALQTLRLLPAHYSLQLPGASPNIVFQITNDGLVAYDPAFEAFLHGSSTKTLHLVGFDIVFDGAPLTMTQFIVSGVTGWIETHALQTLRLLPAYYSLQLPGASPNIVFQITNDGLVAYDPAFEAFLHGSSTKTLHLVGFDIVFDGAPLTMTQFIVSGITGWIETHALQTLRLLPAHYSLQLPGASPNIVFQITNDGLVAYDPAFEAFLHGSSTKTLHLVGFDIVFDGAPLTMTQFIVSGVTGWIETHALQTLRLLPAYYSLQLPGASPNIVFQITNDGLVAYDPAFEAFLHGSSTKTLHLVGFDIVFDGAPLTMTQFIVSGVTGWIETHALQTLRLLPAYYSLQLPGASPNIVFQITNDGLVAYDPAFEASGDAGGFMAGAGTRLLRMVGFDISFDARSAPSSSFTVVGIADNVPSAMVRTLRMLPSHYSVALAGLSPGVAFEVTHRGRVDYMTDAATVVLLTGRGSSTLHMLSLGTRLHAWTRAPQAELLPDEWVAVAIKDERIEAIAFSGEVAHPLAVGPTPQRQSPTPRADGIPAVDEGMRWMVDFGNEEGNDRRTALGAGMALHVPLNGALAHGVDRLLVFGIRHSANAAQSQLDLQAQLEGHRYSQGIGLVPQDAATNNTQETDAHSTMQDADLVHDLEFGKPRLDAGANPAAPNRQDGHWLAWGLGLDAKTFDRTQHADSTDVGDHRDTLAAWTPRADSALLRRIGIGAACNGASMPEASGIGIMPTLRIGSQPYALLTVCDGDGAPAAPSPLGSPGARVGALDAELRRRAAAATGFRAAARTVDILGQAGTGVGYAFERFADNQPPQSTAVDAASLFDQDSSAPWHPWTGGVGATAPRNTIDALARRPDVWVSAVAAQRLRGLREVNPSGLRIGAWGYVESIRPASAAGANPTSDGEVPESDTNQGFIQTPSLTHSATAAILRSGFDPNGADGNAAIDLSSQRVRRAKWLLDGVRQGQSLGALLGYRFERRMQDAGLAGYIASFRTLSAIKTDDAVGLAQRALQDAEAAFAVLQSAVNRWNRADAVFQAASAAYDAAEIVRQSFVDALSENNRISGLAATAATELTAAIAKAAANRATRPRSSSQYDPELRRVVTEIPDPDELLAWQSVQQGLDDDVAVKAGLRDALAASLKALEPLVLQASFETSDSPGSAARKSIDAMAAREAARTARGSTTPPSADESPVTDARHALRDAIAAAWGTASASIAAFQVVDGLDLFRRWRMAHLDVLAAPVWTAQTIPFGVAELPSFPGTAPNDPRFADFMGLQGQLSLLADEVDAIGDLAIAESVHQLVQGNASRSGSTLDMLSKAGVAPPDDFAVVRTPRTGTGLTHRILTALPSGPWANSKGWQDGAQAVRAALEPALEAYACALLPPASTVVCAYDIRSGTDPKVLRRGVIRASEFQMSALDFSAMALASIDMANGATTTELAARVSWLVAERDGLPADQVVTLDPDTVTVAAAHDIVLADVVEVGAAVHQLICSARAADGRDLADTPAFAPDAIADLNGRVAALVADTMSLANALQQARDRLDVAADATAVAAIQLLLLRATQWRIAGAMPTRADKRPAAAQPATPEDPVAALERQADSVVAEMRRRLTLASGVVVAESSDAAAVLARALEVARIVLGNDTLLLPRLSGQALVPWTTSVANSTGLQGGDPMAVHAWLQRASYVREGAGRLLRSLSYASVLSTSGEGDLVVGQLPWVAGDRWVALPPVDGKPMLRGRTATVIHRPARTGPDPSSCKLLLHDAWTEVVPSAEETTGVAFHYNKPNATAPNVALLAVSSELAWDLDSIQRSVVGAVELAKSRGAPADGRVETVWFDDDVPAGATLGGIWSWASRNPAPVTGRRSHVSTYVSQGYSGHSFSGASPGAAMPIASGETLVVYVYLHAGREPASLIVGWTCGNVTATAVWGQDIIDFHHVGPLPPIGFWCRLEVPAATLGLGTSGDILIDGMTFGVLTGGATWGRVGKLSAVGAVHDWTSVRGDRAWMVDRLPPSAIAYTTNEPAWQWISQNPSPFAGAGRGLSSHWSPAIVGKHGHGFTGSSRTLTPQVGDSLFVTVWLDAGSVPSHVVVEWWVAGTARLRAFWGPDPAPSIDDPNAPAGAALRHAGDLPPAGRWVRLEVACNVGDVAGIEIDGMNFLLIGGSAAWGPSGVSSSPMADELILADDEIPS